MATLVGFTNYRRASIGRGDIVLGKTTSIDNVFPSSSRFPANLFVRDFPVRTEFSEKIKVVGWVRVF
jgi:hypothetical protein